MMQLLRDSPKRQGCGVLGRNGGSCNNGDPFIELSSFVTLRLGRFKHRLKLAFRAKGSRGLGLIQG